MIDIDEYKEVLEALESGFIEIIDIEQHRKAVCGALEKQIPQKFIIKDDYDFCPSCEYNFGADIIRKTLRHWKMDYCINCGQALDWSDENE